MTLGKFSIGVGDRFAHQAKAQLEACILAQKAGVEVIPVWNKSNREHLIIGSEPSATRAAADAAVKSLGWAKPYFCDADHINLTTVDRFLAPCDFFTIDVADYIGKPADPASIDDFVGRHSELVGVINLDGVEQGIEISPGLLRNTAAKFLFAIQEAGKIYRKIEAAKGKGNFIPEVSMDETDSAQTPAELLIILSAIADEGIPIQTIAPKFSGRFNKGVDYVGDVAQFAREMALDMAAIRYAVAHYGLPANLKLSVHSGSDKFSIYPAIYASMNKFSTGVHLKTAGTTWLEEITGLAEAGGDGLALAKEIYAEAFDHRAELVRALRHRDRHRPCETPFTNQGQRLVLRAIHLRPAQRSELSRLQSQLPPVAPRGLQDRREDGSPLPRPSRSQRSGDRQERHRKPLRPPHRAGVSRLKKIKRNAMSPSPL